MKISPNVEKDFWVSNNKAMDFSSRSNFSLHPKNVFAQEETTATYTSEHSIKIFSQLNRQFKHAIFLTKVLCATIAIVGAAFIYPNFSSHVAGTAQAASLAGIGPDFMWGVATSSFQGEGNPPRSNWTEYIRLHNLQPVGKSVDFYHRYHEDINLAARLGVKVFRLSIDWSRLEKTQGSWDQAEWLHYDRILTAITQAGMRPMITLDHWVYPYWEYAHNGWAQQGMVNDWLSYARKVVDRASKYNPLWITFNEPEIYIANELQFNTITPFTVATMIRGLASAHNQIYAYIHRITPKAMVSSNAAVVTSGTLPVPGILNFISKCLDYISYDFYYTSHPDLNTIQNFVERRTWNLTPKTEGIYYMSRYFSQNFPRKPLYITENGLPTDNGKPRADGYSPSMALSDTIFWLQRAKADGMNIIGYNYWSITDNYEWGSYESRFGLYTVNAVSDPALIRHETETARTYRSIIFNHGVPRNYHLTHQPVPCNIPHDMWGCGKVAQP